MRQGSSDLSGSQSALSCLCVCERAQLGLREFNRFIGRYTWLGAEGGTCVDIGLAGAPLFKGTKNGW
jgi:hypothetical protein